MNKFKEVFCEILIFLREPEKKQPDPHAVHSEQSFWTDCKIFIYLGAYQTCYPNTNSINKNSFIATVKHRKGKKF